MTASLPPLAALSFRARCAPKHGDSENEYEDAYAPRSGPAPGAQVFTVAVSDGASSSIFAREWARLLADEFASGPFDEATAGPRIAALGRRWREQVSGRPLPWYAEEKLAQGSHATLLAVTWDLAGGSWSAHAVGDTCLFVVRDRRLRVAFPLTRSVAFDSRPRLLSTHGDRPLAPFQKAAGTFTGRDRFLLMSDALAVWFLARVEADKQPWDELPAGDADWREWLRAQRTGGGLRNDDVTCVEVNGVRRPR